MYMYHYMYSVCIYLIFDIFAFDKVCWCCILHFYICIFECFCSVGIKQLGPLHCIRLSLWQPRRRYAGIISL